MKNDVVDMIHRIINMKIEETIWGSVITKANTKNKIHAINAIYFIFLFNSAPYKMKSSFYWNAKSIPMRFVSLSFN